MKYSTLPTSRLAIDIVIELLLSSSVSEFESQVVKVSMLLLLLLLLTLLAWLMVPLSPSDGLTAISAATRVDLA